MSQALEGPMYIHSQVYLLFAIFIVYIGIFYITHVLQGCPLSRVVF